MDGVPYITQPPVEPGEAFTYTFAPPDPGTFFFHPHCDTLAALRRGLAGVLTAEDLSDAGLFAADVTLALKGWRGRRGGGFGGLPDMTSAAGGIKVAGRVDMWG